MGGVLTSECCAAPSDVRGEEQGGEGEEMDEDGAGAVKRQVLWASSP